MPDATDVQKRGETMFDIIGYLSYENGDVPARFRSSIICAEYDSDIRGVRFTLPGDIDDIVIANVSKERVEQILLSRESLVDVSQDGIMCFGDGDDSDDGNGDDDDCGSNDDDQDHDAGGVSGLFPNTRGALLNGVSAGGVKQKRGILSELRGDHDTNP